jgi:hypothetical protein
MRHGKDTDLILYQEKPNGPYALLKSLDQAKLNAAPQTVLYTQLTRLIDGDRRQRHTHPNDINEVLRRLLRDSEACIHKIDPADIGKIHIEPVSWERCRVVDVAERDSMRSFLSKWNDGKSD